MTEFEPAPAEVTDLAEACVRFVADALGLSLDYTPETLPILDHYLRERARDIKPEVAGLLAPAAGAYFGEVARRQLAGARWSIANHHYDHYRLEFDPFFLYFNPLGVALEVLTMTEAEGWAAHFSVLDEARPVLARALEASASMPKEDYYTLSVRWEALEQIADLLSALESRQPKPRRFAAEVYRAAAGDLLAKEQPS